MELHLSAPKVKKLIKAGKLAGICFGRKSCLESDWRYLDPSPRYKQALEVQELLLSGKRRENLIDIPLLSTSEFCEITEITSNHLYVMIHRGIVKPRKFGKFQLFSVLELRRFLRRKQKAKEAGVPLHRIVEWTLEKVQESDSDSLLESEEDREMEGALRRIFRQPEPQRSKMLRDFWDRYELAKRSQS